MCASPAATFSNTRSCFAGFSSCAWSSVPPATNSIKSFAFLTRNSQSDSVSKQWTFTRLGWSSIWPTRNSCRACSKNFLSSSLSMVTILSA